MALKVIGAGLGRTGTLSLKTALEQLGFGKCYHMAELMNNPQQVHHWLDLQAQQKTDLEALFSGFQSTVDYPACRFYHTFFKAYPDAKVVLSVRDPERWYESARNTIYATKPKTLGQKLGMLWKMLTKPKVRKLLPVFQMADQIIWEGQFEGEFEDKAFALKKFHEHIEEVKAHIPADQLLIFEVKDGWGPLCNFLEVPVPDTPFPRVNSRDDFPNMIAQLLNKGKFEL